MSRRDDRLSAFKREVDALASRTLDQYVASLAASPPPRAKEFNDPVWGTIVASPAEMAIIDSPLFQRLQDIRQLGTVHHVYRSANHTRFEHSMGAMHAMTVVVREINENLSQQRILSDQVETAAHIDSSLEARLRVAALLHDIGHGFMSHVSENAVKAMGWAVDLAKAARTDIGDPTLGEGKKPAELASYYLVQSTSFRKLADHLAAELGLGPSTTLVDVVSRAILGLEISKTQPFLSQLLSGPFDVDKLDYIQRDAYFCGVPAIIDVNRLLRKLRTTVCSPSDIPLEIAGTLIDPPDRIVVTGIADSGARTLDEFALARSLMIDKVYRHQKTRAQEAIVSSMLEILTELSTNPVGIMWKMTDSEFVAIPRDQWAKKMSIMVRTRREKRRLALADELRQRHLIRADYVAAFVWSSDRSREDVLDVDLQVEGIDRLREDARRSSARRDLVRALSAEIASMCRALSMAIPVAGVAADLPCLLRVDQSDDPARLKGRSLLARAFLIGTDQKVSLFSDEYPGTEDWSELYLVNRDFSAVFCPRELASLVYLASEVVFYERYGLAPTHNMARRAHVDSDDVDSARLKLTNAGHYNRRAPSLESLPLPLRKGSSKSRLATVAERFTEYSSGEAVRFGLQNHNSTGGLSVELLGSYVSQMQTDDQVEDLLKLLEHVKLFKRADLAATVDAAFGSFGILGSEVVVSALGDPDESSGAVTYLTKDHMSSQGAVYERIDKLEHTDRKEVVLLDDFLGLGNRTAGIIAGWLGSGEEARPLSTACQERLRAMPIRLIYAAGLPTGKDDLLERLAILDLDVQVFVGDQALPTVKDAGLRDSTIAQLELVGRELLRSSKGKSVRVAKANALGYGGHGLLVAFPWGTPKQTITPLWLSGVAAGGPWRGLFPRGD